MSLIDRIYATGEVEAADGALVDAFPAALPERHAREIERLVRDLGLVSTLETGMAYGLSTLAICGVHEERGEGSHVAIDPHQSSDWRGIGVLNLERAGLSGRARVIEARSDEALPRLRDEGLRVDFALIDGLHLFDATLVDFYLIDRLMDPGGVVVFHDTWMPAVAQAVAYVRANRAYEPLEAGDGAMVALRKVADDDRPWDFHRHFGASRPSLAEWLRPRVGTRVRRLATHPLKTRIERERLARRVPRAERELLRAVDPVISPRDAMYTGDGAHYFSVGLSAIRAIEATVPESVPSRRILDMPCGHGRVLRFLRARHPAAEITACDLDGDGVAFCAERFGARAQRSSADLDGLELPGPFDLIWCGSLLTHLDAAASAALLRLFARSLAPGGGVAVVTTHGVLVAERLRAGDSYQLDAAAARNAIASYEETGFGYADYPWSPGYGVSVSSLEWIERAAEEAGLRVTQTSERGWDDHQDVVALERAATA